MDELKTKNRKKKKKKENQNTKLSFLVSGLMLFFVYGGEDDRVFI